VNCEGIIVQQRFVNLDKRNQSLAEKSTMKILLITNRYPVFSETFFKQKVEGLAKMGLQVTVLSLGGKGDWKETSEIPIIYSWFKSSWLEKTKLLLFPGGPQIKRAFQILKTHGFRFSSIKLFLRGLPYWYRDFDIIDFCFSGIAVTEKSVFPFLKPAKIFVSCRGSAEKVRPLIDPTRKSELSDVLVKADRIHCVSADMARTIQAYGCQPNKLFINRPSIDIEYFQFREKINFKPIRILSIGRLNWQKGLVYGIQAAAILKSMQVEFSYTIIGGGDEFAQLTYAINQLDLSESVKLVGPKNHEFVLQALNQSSIFFLPSIYEGISNAALEAMAIGIPIVSTPAGGMEEAIENLKTGLIVPFRDARKMAQAILFLKKNPIQAEDIRKQAREKVEQDFSLTRQLQQFSDEYHQSQKADSN